MGWEYTEAQNDGLTGINVSFAALSFMSCGFILFMYARAAELQRFFFFKLVAFLSISDLLFAVSNFLGAPADGSAACYVQALGRSFFDLASCLWSVAIAHTLYLTVLAPSTVHHADIDKYLKRYHIFAWGVPLLLTILPFSTSSYGDTGGWCWISTTNNYEAGTAWRLIQFYVPVWISIIFNSYVCYAVSRKFASLIDSVSVANSNVSSNSSSETPPDTTVSSSSISLLARIKYYPLVLIVCNVFATIDRLYQISGNRVYWLSVLHLIGSSSQGILNAIVYGYTPTVRALIRPVFTEFYSDVVSFFKECFGRPKGAVLEELTDLDGATLSAPHHKGGSIDSSTPRDAVLIVDSDGQYASSSTPRDDVR